MIRFHLFCQTLIHMNSLIVIAGLADNGAYFIQNLQDNLCISAGPLIDRDKLSLFKEGLPITRNCSFGRENQWVIKQTKTEGPFYTLHHLNSNIFDRPLNATVKGEFISYFPNPMRLRMVKATEDHQEEEGYAIYDAVKGKCIGSNGENYVLHDVNCDFHQDLSQRWKFILVNEHRHVEGGTLICPSFWDC